MKGLSSEEQAELMALLKERGDECVLSGSVMMIELVQVVEDFLVTHNLDPNMSAWEQMKAREAQEQQERQRKEREQEEVLRKLILQDSATGDPEESPSGHRQFHTIGGEVEKELARQVEALRMAGLKRKQRGNLVGFPSTVEADRAEEDEDDAFNDDFDEPPIVGSSRYQTDFIELGLLGRGGGGEVIKVRNRLDKRIYAVKKIILESEEGKYAKFSAVQNRKLRREVTTISRMTHKNIVRYYQGWVEGGETAEPVEEVKLIEKNDNEDEDESTSDEDENKGWWASSPFSSGTSKPMHINETEQLIESISQAWNNADSESSGSDSPSNSKGSAREAISGFGSPLMTGKGFMDDMYDGLVNKRKHSESRKDLEDNELWDESSVKVDASLGQRILYIQMEYCNTTLRKVIDESPEKPIEETENFRMVRQIVEALIYLHGQNLIHRDLVSSKGRKPLLPHASLLILSIETRKYFHRF